MNPAIPYLLLVEDEPTQRQILTEYLSRQGLRVAAVADGRTMRETLELEIPQLLLLDVGLPGEDGFVLARWLRERHPGVGIIMVTGASDSVDRIVGLETGADDYVTKPYDPRELLARIKSVLRRTLSHVHRAVSNEPVHESPPIALGRCTFDRERRILLAHDGTEKPLTATEFDYGRFVKSSRQGWTFFATIQIDPCPVSGCLKPPANGTTTAVIEASICASLDYDARLSSTPTGPRFCARSGA